MSKPVAEILRHRSRDGVTEVLILTTDESHAVCIKQLYVTRVEGGPPNMLYSSTYYGTDRAIEVFDSNNAKDCFNTYVEKFGTKTSIEISKMVENIECRHFRTAYDTGAHSNAQIVWNSVRALCGLPYKGVRELPTQCSVHKECHVLGDGCKEDPWNSKCGRFESWLEKKYQEGPPAHGVHPNSEIGKWMAERAKKDEQ